MPVHPLRRLLPAGSLALLVAVAAAPTAEAAPLKRITTVSAKTAKSAFPNERGSGGIYNASLPRGKYCRGDIGSALRVWWSERGGQGVPDDGRCKSVPGVVQVAADQLEASRKAGVRLGMKSVRDGSRPRGTGGRWPRGGDSRYDAIILGSAGPGGESGLNVCPTGQKRAGSRAVTSGTYMRIFTGAATGRAQSERELRATVTHEYYHGLQCRSLGLDRIVARGGDLALATPPASLMEASAEWFAAAVYPLGQVGEHVGSGFTLGRGTLLCSVPTSLLSADVQNPYTTGALLLGAFGDTKAGARAIRDGLRRARTTAFQTPPDQALRNAWGDAAIATGMTTAIDRSCAWRRTITGDLPVLAGTPSPQSLANRVDLVPGGAARGGQLTLGPLSTGIIVFVAGQPPAGRGPAGAIAVTAAPSGAAAMALYSTGAGGDLSSGFDPALRASVANANGYAVAVVANPSLSAPLTVQLSGAAN